MVLTFAVQIIDQLERKLMRLDIEASMLQKEDDAESRRRLDDVNAALAQTREEATTYKVRLQVCVHHHCPCHRIYFVCMYLLNLPDSFRAGPLFLPVTRDWERLQLTGMGFAGPERAHHAHEGAQEAD
jgi:hypothetical protein